MIKNISLSLIAAGFWIYISIQIYNIFKPNNEEINIDTNQISHNILNGKWIRESDSVIVTYISNPTNKFQVLNNIIDHDNNKIMFNVGEYKLINIKLIDSVNNIYTAENLLGG